MDLKNFLLIYLTKDFLITFYSLLCFGFQWTGAGWTTVTTGAGPGHRLTGPVVSAEKVLTLWARHGFHGFPFQICGKNDSTWKCKTLIWILVLLFSSCVTLSKRLDLSESQCLLHKIKLRKSCHDDILVKWISH